MNLNEICRPLRALSCELAIQLQLQTPLVYFDFSTFFIPRVYFRQVVLQIRDDRDDL